MMTCHFIVNMIDWVILSDKTGFPSFFRTILTRREVVKHKLNELVFTISSPGLLKLYISTKERRTEKEKKKFLPALRVSLV